MKTLFSINGFFLLFENTPSPTIVVVLKKIPFYWFGRIFVLGYGYAINLLWSAVWINNIYIYIYIYIYNHTCDLMLEEEFYEQLFEGYFWRTSEIFSWSRFYSNFASCVQCWQPPEFESRYGHFWRVFHLFDFASLCLVVACPI